MAARLTTYLVVAIVAATLIAGLIVGAQRDDSSGPVDLIIHNARVYTADDHGTIAQAIAVRGNKILRVGSEREVMRYRRPQTEVIDARGAAVLPGFNDAHASLVDEGRALGSIDLSEATGVDDVAARLADWSAAHPEATAIVGRGWDPAAFPERLSRGQLDTPVPDRPVVLWAKDNRAAWVNSAALRAAGIGRRTAAPRGGEIVRDRRGEPTGLLRGSAADLVRPVLPPQIPADEARIRALQDSARHGITSVHDFAENASAVEFYRRLAADDREQGLTRVYVGVPVKSASEAQALETLGARLPDDPLFKAGLAYVSPGMEAAELRKIVSAIDVADWQPAVLASSAEHVTEALDAFEAASRSNGSRSAERRNRLELVRDVEVADIARMKGRGLIATAAPSPLLDLRRPDAGRPAPSLDVIEWPLRSLDKAGVRLAFATDAPDEPASPLAAIAAAVRREDAADEALTLKAAINAWTSGAAWASYDEHRKGALEPGMLADLIVLSADIFATPPADLDTVQVDVTVMDGRVVYRRASS